MQVNVLGPIEVTRAGRAIRLGGPGQRTVLAVLALEHGRVVTMDRLVDAVWDTGPPVTARTKIQAHISALRRAIGQPARCADGPLQTISAGYVLRGADVRIDLAEFTTLTAQARGETRAGRPRAAAGLFEAALALWRGPAFADVSASAIRSAAGPLDERRLLAVEAKAEADLAIGRCENVVAELSAWLVALPLRERLRALLMVGLYRLGCRGDALNLYREGRRIMIAELGLEPGLQLRDLHQRILADHQALLGTWPDVSLASRRPGRPAGAA